MSGQELESLGERQHHVRIVVGIAVAAEQAGWETHWDQPFAEISPAVHAFQALTIKKWEQYLERDAAKKLHKGSLVREARAGSDEAAE